MEKEAINIGILTNQNYALHVGVLIYSILKNCSSASSINFYIFDGSIEEENKRLMINVCENFNAKINFIIPDENDWKLFNGLKLGANLPRILYCKLLFPDKIKDINKILILDSDIIVEDDIKKLWDHPLNGKTIGAVPDAGIEIGNISKKSMSIPLEKEYMNSGVILVDCIKWRKNKILNKIINFIKENPEKINIQEQDGLNFILQDDWQKLPYEWNVIHFFYYHSKLLKEKLGRERFNEIRKHPKLIHYTVKPWIYGKVHPLKNRYWYYLKQTPWKNYKYQDKNFKNSILKIIRILIRPLSVETKLYIRKFLEDKILHKKIKDNWPN